MRMRTMRTQSWLQLGVTEEEEKSQVKRTQRPGGEWERESHCLEHSCLAVLRFLGAANPSVNGLSKSHRSSLGLPRGPAQFVTPNTLSHLQRELARVS